MHKLPALLLLLPMLLLTACATPATDSAGSFPAPPPMPPVSTPQPTKPYSQTVSDDIKRWEKELTDTLSTLPPSQPLGR